MLELLLYLTAIKPDMGTALIALDLINDIVHPDSPMANAAQNVAARGVIENANTALTRATAAG